MKIFSLFAKKPIVKEYQREPNGTIQKTPYPLITEFTSEVAEISDILEFEQLIRRVSTANGCLVKGCLQRDLVSESRAGSTNPDIPTRWICLDVDGVEHIQTIDLFLAELGLADIDHIVQWSSSMGIESSSGFRCHIFMLLDKEYHPDILKMWLQDLNFKSKTLSSQLTLTKTSNSLRWPLDITTCQNDKLLYVSPPILGNGLCDPFPGNSRISLQLRANKCASIPSDIPNETALRQRVQEKVNELRKSQGLPIKKHNIKYEGTIAYMEKPDTAVVTGERRDRGFVYLNLNGGDSWGYYYPEDNPRFIFNFKGEPVYRTEDLLPGYWAKIRGNYSQGTANAQGIVHLAFRDLPTGTYWNGTYDRKSDEIALYPAKSKEQLKDFMRQHGQTLPDPVPDFTKEFDPNSTTVIDTVRKTINTYQPPSFQKCKPAIVLSPPPTVHKIVSHVLGYHQETIERFYNWLACIMQYKERTGTAWVWQGTQGTGKGLLYNNILSPIFGQSNCVTKRVDEMDSQFTGFFANKLILFCDEMQVNKANPMIDAKLKNLIVEPVVSIRHMFQEAILYVNRGNLILASNMPDVVTVPYNDRRFSVGPYQAQKLQITSYEVEELLPTELQAFCDYLRIRSADRSLARLPVENEARAEMMDISTTAIDSVVKALAEGNLRFFWDHLLDRGRQPTSISLTAAYNDYKELMKELITTGRTKLSRGEIQTLVRWNVSGIPNEPHKFTAYMKHHKVMFKYVWVGGETVLGTTVNWSIDPAWLATCQQEIDKGRL